MNIIYTIALFCTGIAIAHVYYSKYNAARYPKVEVEATETTAADEADAPLTDLSQHLEEAKALAHAKLKQERYNATFSVAKEYVEIAKEHGVTIRLHSITLVNDNDLGWWYVTYEAADGLYRLKTHGIGCLGYDAFVSKLEKV